MKKIILILIGLFTLSGCNYIELNNIGIVTLMAINYENDNYNVLIEIKENKKDKDSSILYEATSTSIEKAIQELSLAIDKELYFIDLNVLVIDENTINNKLNAIVDYLTRDVTIGTNFNIIIDNNAKDDIKSINEKDKIAGEYIKKIFDNSSNNLINVKYSNFLTDYLNGNKDIVLPLGKLQNEEYIINEAVIFSNNKIVNSISLNMVYSYNLLNNINCSYFYEIEYNGQKLIYRVSENKSKIFYKDNKINLDVTLNGSFIEVEKVNLEDEKTINEVLKILENKIEDEINTLILECKKYESDILGFKKAFYNKKRIKIDRIQDLNYEININSNLDREGLIFNSLGEYYEKSK